MAGRTLSSIIRRRPEQPNQGRHAMRFGLFVTLECEGTQDPAAHLKDLIEQVRAAKDAGFDSLWLPQHFVTGPSMRQFAASPIMGYLANLSGGMRMGTAVLLLPML